VSGQITNDLVRLVPRTEFPGGRVLEFDFAGLEIGVAEYDEGPTGCTVFSFGTRASVSIDVRGGSPDVSAANRDVIEVVCFAGGSANPLLVIPICGGLIGGVWKIVLYCIGFARAHETDTGRAVLAVILPIIVCCGGAFVLGMMLGLGAFGFPHH